MAVFVLDQHKKPLMPCSEKRARLLLARGCARVHRIIPFTIRLVDRTGEDSVLQPVRLKFYPPTTQEFRDHWGLSFAGHQSAR